MQRESSNMSTTAGNLLAEVESESCTAIKQKYKNLSITNDTLTEIYQTCNPGAGKATIEIGPKLLGSVFESEIFQTNCNKRNLKFNLGKSATFAALASVQGSGNTWSRILLEDMTGLRICYITSYEK